MEDLRLRLLSRAIEASPDAAINYMLRGEYWLSHGTIQPAIADFEDAIVLANAEVEQSEWGYLQQAVLDRAELGLRMASLL